MEFIEKLKRFIETMDPEFKLLICIGVVVFVVIFVIIMLIRRSVSKNQDELHQQEGAQKKGEEDPPDQKPGMKLISFTDGKAISEIENIVRIVFLRESEYEYGSYTFYSQSMGTKKEIFVNNLSFDHCVMYADVAKDQPLWVRETDDDGDVLLEIHVNSVHDIEFA